MNFLSIVVLVLNYHPMRKKSPSPPSLVQVLDMTVSGSHEWRTIASMSTRRSSVGVGVLQVRIRLVMVIMVVMLFMMAGYCCQFIELSL